MSDEAARGSPPAGRAVPVTRHVTRTGRGSLTGGLVVAEDWDSDEVNDAVANDFDLADPGQNDDRP
jgi:hypothetical protein